MEDSGISSPHFSRGQILKRGITGHPPTTR